MKAVVFSKYGPPEVLTMTNDHPKPVPKANQVLIRNHATTVTQGDWHVRAADPFMVRMMFGFFSPKSSVRVLGCDFSGEIEAVGKDVTEFKVGDRVFGESESFGGYAEYLTVPANGPMARIPDDLEYNAAAAVPTGGLTALHFLRKAEVKAGQHVLVFGAGGAVGSYAVQLAKHSFECTVTAVCSGSKSEYVRSLGADQVIDYTQTKFYENRTESSPRYDIIFDCAGICGDLTFKACRDCLSDNGVYLTVAMDGSILWQQFRSPKAGQGKRLITDICKPTQDMVKFMADQLETGKIKAIIDSVHSLDEIQEMHRYVQTGQKRGSVIIDIDSETAGTGTTESSKEGQQTATAA
eukprot:Clim_evm17s198 gene=Clim_evmTU17s198